MHYLPLSYLKNRKRKRLLLSLFACVFISGCSPLKSSPHDQRHQTELALHEVQTNLDDLRHDIHCFKTELQILDGRIKHFENTLTTLKQQDLEKQQAKLDQIYTQLQTLEKRWSISEKTWDSKTQELHYLTSHAKETSTALMQFKERIEELEKELIVGQRKFEELGKLKQNIEYLTKSIAGGEGFKTYRVCQGDSLERIAKFHKTSVEKIKKLNDLDQDLIVIGQDLKIPLE